MLSFVEYDSTNDKVKCLCDCGRPALVNRYLFLKQSTKSCGCLKARRSPFWAGHGDISGAYWTQVKGNAKKRGITVVATISEAWEIFLHQGGRCAISGAEIGFSRNYTEGKRTKHQTASLDRKDSLKGYEKENLQWVHKVVNGMKMNISDQDFFHWCSVISSHQSKSTKQ